MFFRVKGIRKYENLEAFKIADIQNIHQILA